MDSSIILDVSFYSLLSYFLIYSFLGWCLEVAFCSINTGKFVNRGFLNGPVCPIYGVGATLVTLLLTPLENNFLLLFVGSVLITSTLELLTGFVLEKLFHTRWWDYSHRKFNVGGYICLQFSLAWGVGCLFLMKVLHPLIFGLVHKTPRILGISLLVIFSALFICDFVVTLSAMLKLRKDLGEISKIAEELHKGSEVLAEGLGNTAISAATKIEELDIPAQTEKAKQKLAQSKDKWELSKEESIQKFKALQEKYPHTEKMFSRNMRTRTRLMKAFPNAKNKKFTEAWEQLKLKVQQAESKKASSQTKDAVSETSEPDTSANE